MITNKKSVASPPAKIVQMILKISKGINHGSTILVIEMLLNVTELVNCVEFIVDETNE
jgi:hypothetical protein